MALRPITFDLQLFKGPEDEERSRQALLWLMLALMKINEGYIEQYDPPKLYDTRVVYKAEKRREQWADIPTVLRQGYGDCEDLAAWRSAELRAEGVDAMPYIKWAKKGKRTTFHSLTRITLPDGSEVIEDPSRALGMRHPIVRRPVYIEG